MDIYDVINLLGQGTFGTVHLCERKHNKQKIVVKKINSDLNREALQTAKNEVDILKSLNHPNIIEYYYSFSRNGTIYILMEYANRGTLTNFLAENSQKKLPPQTVINLFCQILMGLHHIHSKNVIHRDLKCDNLFMTGVRGDIIKIGDFGISKRVMNNKFANTLIGTCNYVAPELCDGKPYNIKSDIWSLGCILYEMCEMEKMFDGALANVVLSITAGRLKQVETKVYGIQMQELIEFMLRINPDDRPDTKVLICFLDIFPSLVCLQVGLGCIDGSNEFKKIYSLQ